MSPESCYNEIKLKKEEDWMDRSEQCGFVIKQLNDAMERRSNNALRAQGLTLTQMNVLMLLEDLPEQTASLKDLEHALGVAQSTAAGVVARMEQKGFLTSFGDPDDRRVKLVSLSEAGRHCCKVAEADAIHAEEELLRGLSKEDRATFLRLLRHVRENVSSSL